MNKRRLVLGLCIAALLATVTVAAGPEPEAHDIVTVMDTETNQLFGALSPAGQGLMSQVWEQIRETAPREVWESQIAQYTRAFHEHELGEDGSGVGSGVVDAMGRSCTIVKSLAMTWRYTSAITGSYCTMDELSVNVVVQGFWGAGVNACGNCNVVLAWVLQPSQCGTWTAVSTHVWGYNPSGIAWLNKREYECGS